MKGKIGGKIGDVHEILTFQPDGSAGFKKSMENVQMSWTSPIFPIFPNDEA